MTQTLDPETRRLSREVAERHAFRHLAAANLRGAGLPYLADLSEVTEYSIEIAFHVELLGRLESSYAELGGADLGDALLARLERLPYPESRLELAVCLSITDRGELALARSYLESSYPCFAEVSRLVLDRERPRDREAELLTDLCRKGDQRVRAQRHWNRWVQGCLASVGRLGTPADLRTAELGLRAHPAAEVARAFLDDLEPLRDACGLSLPTLEELGLELPEDLRARFPAA